MSKDNGSKENEIHVEFEQKDAQEPGGETKAFDSVNSKSGKDAKSQITVENGKAPVERCEERGAIKNYTPLSMIWKVLRPLLIFVVSAGLIVYLGITAYRYVENSYFAPVDADSTISKTIEIKTGSSLSTIATTLHEEGIIRNKLVFQLYVDLKDMASSLIAGEYAFSPSMSMDDIIKMLGDGDGGRQIVKVTFTEGMTIENIADAIENKGIFSEDQKLEFLELCNDTSEFSDFKFIKAIVSRPNVAKRKYLLEGYLFPDTYEFYIDESPKDIIVRLLTRFDTIFTLSYEDRANEIGMSIDEIITLASLIEWEALPNDYGKVSAVFYNRLSNEMTLDSCATMRYVTGEKKFVYTSIELEIDSPYNTYMYAGLPVGPVANPGQKAIEAALSPNEEYVSDGYLYFCNKEAGTDDLAFARTLEEHNANVEMYKEFW
ncbi:MAG: endolytic transglycosylase MltG [Clostridia bacterium]|jgi:UPF0755 protein|nr:endolytic transglycosylase MltG [Clostridia bacterium]MBT7122960.1 endolytic transglycosylase MltG [Clostridia bacterium]